MYLRMGKKWGLCHTAAERIRRERRGGGRSREGNQTYTHSRSAGYGVVRYNRDNNNKSDNYPLGVVAFLRCVERKTAAAAANAANANAATRCCGKRGRNYSAQERHHHKGDRWQCTLFLLLLFRQVFSCPCKRVGPFFLLDEGDLSVSCVCVCVVTDADNHRRRRRHIRPLDTHNSFSSSSIQVNAHIKKPGDIRI